MLLSISHKKNQMDDMTLLHQPYCTVKDTFFFPEDSSKGNLACFQKKFQQSEYKENYSLNYQISDAKKESDFFFLDHIKIKLSKIQYSAMNGLWVYCSVWDRKGSSSVRVRLDTSKSQLQGWSGTLAVTAKLQVTGTAHTAIGHSPWQPLHLFYLARRRKSNCLGFYIINTKISLEPFGKMQILMRVNSLSYLEIFTSTVNRYPEWMWFWHKKLQHVGLLTCKIKMPKQIVCILPSF